jgi:tetratricopeptide (TPR) repeat protein
VVYLDNLESLLVGPRDLKADVKRAEGASGEAPSEQDAFASWRSEALRRIWGRLYGAARDTDKLYLVASCRYRNADFEGDTLPVSPLPADALYRLMGWFPGLRQLAGQTRARLVERLAGHPRAVEFANDLIEDALRRWEDRHGVWQLPARPDAKDLEREWQDLVEPALPKVREKLWGDLLLAAIWERVLDDRARRMLYRMTWLRRPWGWDLIAQLGEPDESLPEAEAAAERLQRTSLLEQVEVVVRVDQDQYRTVRRYTLHPAAAQFIAARFGDDEALRRSTHHRIGAYLEAQAAASPYIALEAGHHLFEAGEYDRSYALLGPASDWLQNHGRVREGLQVLKPFLGESVCAAMAKQRVGRLLGTVGLAYYRLGQVEQAIGYFEQDLAIMREIGDRWNEGATLGNLGAAYANLGQVEQAIGYFEQSLAIAREIGDRWGEGATLGNLGEAYYRLGQVERRSDSWSKPLRL